MSSDDLHKLIVALGTAIAGILAPLGVIYAASITRTNKTSEVTIESLKAEIVSLKAKLSEKEKQDEQIETDLINERRFGLRWRELSMYWFDAAHNMRRACQDARQVAESQSRSEGSPRPTWNDPLLLPKFEDPIPQVEIEKPDA